MNIREKLQELSIYVPEAAQRYRAGKGCLVWLPAEAEDGSAALFLMLEAEFMAFALVGLASLSERGLELRCHAVVVSSACTAWTGSRGPFVTEAS